TSRVTTARTHGAGRRRLCAYAGTRFVVATAKSRRAVALTPTIPGFDPRPRRAVVVRGGWDGHQPVEATEEFIPHLREHGFDVEIFDSPAPYADADLMAQTDLVVQCNTMSTIEPDQLSGLIAAVEAGTGLAGWHGAIADSDRKSTRLNSSH